jgi:sialate O-acetylesterase
MFTPRPLEELPAMKLPRTVKTLALLAALAMVSASARADVRLPKIFGEHMVLQQQLPIQVWGWADAGEKVTVTLGDRSATATACEKGKWSVKLDPVNAGGPYKLKVAGKNELVLDDVLVGEVWVGSGQSNMEWPVHASVNAGQEVAAAKYPNIRLFTVAKNVAENPVDDVQGAWAECSPETVPGFSAALYFFGRKLHGELNVPVGLVNSSWGGTLCEAWTSKEGLSGDPDFQPILQRAAQFQAGNPNQASVLYNGMIYPILPFSIRGAIWYQGESNRDRAVQYTKLFPAMITDWRKQWKEGDFPFLFVQLAPFIYGNNPSFLAELWEAQFKTLSLPNTGMAVITDITELKDIHPKNKQDVGLRLALWALAKTYGKDLVYSGPLYKEMKIEGDKIRLSFDHLGGGLVAKGGPLKFFTIAGEDGNFVPAEAVIDGESIVVSSAQVTKPVAVRFAWQEDAEPNLFNQAGLPASPFRTDNLPLLTAGRL